MIQVGTICKVTDKTGVVEVKCIKVFGSAKRRVAKLGEMVIVAVRRINPKILHKIKWHRRKKFLKGTIHRALIIRAKVNYCRWPGVMIKFNENTVVLVNKKAVPLSNRVYGPVLKELCMEFPSLGCVTRYMI